MRVCDKVPKANPQWDHKKPDAATSFAPARIFNIGNNKPVDLMVFIEALEKCLGKKAQKNFLPMQDGDVPETFADISDLEKEVGFHPSTPLEKGIREFVEWYKSFYVLQ